MRRPLLTAALTAAALAAAGCASSEAAAGGSGSGHVTLRLGLLANITHEPALVGLNKGLFARNLGPGVTLKPTVFSSGTEETTALLAGQLDAAYVGPNPAINAWQKSNGTAIKIVSGAASGGASLVVKPGITSAAQLRGKSLATPSLGNIQDVAARYWLKQASGPAAAAAANAELGTLAGKGLKPSVLTQALKNLTFTNDPIAPSLRVDARHAVAVGLLKPVSLSGIYDLGPLNRLLKAAGEPQVSS